MSLQKDPYSWQSRSTLGLTGPAWSYASHGYWKRISIIYGAAQNEFSLSLLARHIYYSPYSQLAGHLGEIFVYYSMRREHYWPHTEYNVYMALQNCCTSARNNSGNEQRRLRQLLPASRALEFFKADILGFLLNMLSSIQFVLGAKDHYSKLTTAARTSKTIAS